MAVCARVKRRRDDFTPLLTFCWKGHTEVTLPYLPYLPWLSCFTVKGETNHTGQLFMKGNVSVVGCRNFSSFLPVHFTPIFLSIVWMAMIKHYVRGILENLWLVTLQVTSLLCVWWKINIPKHCECWTFNKPQTVCSVALCNSFEMSALNSSSVLSCFQTHSWLHNVTAVSPEADM